MFSKKHRLAKSNDIRLVYSRGRAFFSPFFVIKVFSAATADHRFTVVVSTKVSKLANRRNSIKRLVREYIRLHMSQLKPGDYIITVKPGVAGLAPENIRVEFGTVLQSSKLLTP